MDTGVHPIETAPHDRPIMIWLSDYHHRWVIAEYAETALWGPCWRFDGEYTVKISDQGVTHWVEIPPPPSESTPT